MNIQDDPTVERLTELIRETDLSLLPDFIDAIQELRGEGEQDVTLHQIKKLARKNSRSHQLRNRQAVRLAGATLHSELIHGDIDED